MHLITYDGVLLAVTTSRGAVLDHAVAALPPGHNQRRIALAMCLYARDIESAGPRAPFDQEHAERYARGLLIDSSDVANAPYDQPLADQLRLPVALVRQRRRDLGLPAVMPTPMCPGWDDAEFVRWQRGETLEASLDWH